MTELPPNRLSHMVDAGCRSTGDREMLTAVGKYSVDIDMCPCCGFRTGRGTCPVCFWTDDGRRDPDAEGFVDGPNGHLTLSHARLNFAIYGASHPRYQEMVRPPRPDERP